jgi:hypothetical protein
MKRLKRFNESFSKDFYTKLNEVEYKEEQTKWRSSLYDMGVRQFYTSNEIKWFKSKGWDDYYLRKKQISGDTRLDFFKLNPRRDIKLFESYIEPNYQRLTYDLYSQGRNPLKSEEFTKMEIGSISATVNGKVDSFIVRKGHKKKHVVTVRGKVPFLGWGNEPVGITVSIEKYEDGWFFVHIFTSRDSRTSPESIGAGDQSFWKCDQIEGVVDLIKKEIRIDI